MDIAAGFASEFQHSPRTPIQATSLLSEQKQVVVDAQEHSSVADQLLTDSAAPASSSPTIQLTEQPQHREEPPLDTSSPFLRQPVFSTPSNSVTHEAEQQTGTSVSAEVTDYSDYNQPASASTFMHDLVLSAPSDNLVHEAGQQTGGYLEVTGDSTDEEPPPGYVDAMGDSTDEEPPPGYVDVMEDSADDEPPTSPPFPSVQEPVVSAPSDNVVYEAGQQAGLSVEFTGDSNDNEASLLFPSVPEPVLSAPSDNVAHEAGHQKAMPVSVESTEADLHAEVAGEVQEYPSATAEPHDLPTERALSARSHSVQSMEQPAHTDTQAEESAYLSHNSSVPEPVLSAPSDDMTQETSKSIALPVDITEYSDDNQPPTPFSSPPPTFSSMTEPMLSAPPNTVGHEAGQQTTMSASVELTEDSYDDQPPPRVPTRSVSIRSLRQKSGETSTNRRGKAKRKSSKAERPTTKTPMDMAGGYVCGVVLW